MGSTLTEVEAVHLLGLTEEAWMAADPTTRRMVRDGCFSKSALSHGVARHLVQAAQADPVKYAALQGCTAYRCPYNPTDHHWHVGHPPAMHTLQAIALAIRDLHGNLPNRG